MAPGSRSLEFQTARNLTILMSGQRCRAALNTYSSKLNLPMNAFGGERPKKRTSPESV
jgi:hypothetical protein